MENLTNTHPLLAKERMRDLLKKIELRAIEDLKPRKKALRKYTEATIENMIHWLERTGYVPPVLVLSDNTLAGGELVYAALKRSSATHIPSIYCDHLTDAEIKAMSLFYERMAYTAEWENDELAIELSDLLDAGFNHDQLGYTSLEIDQVLHINDDGSCPEDNVDLLPPDYHPVTKIGDVWLLGEHRLIYGDSLKKETFEALLGDEKVQMVFCDHPYNVRINGHVK
jgi:hypothetical protein